jgi:hypothetical protein
MKQEAGRSEAARRAESGALAVAQGHGWMYALREEQELYSAEPVTLLGEHSAMALLAKLQPAR